MKLKELLFENRTLRQTILKNTFWLISSDIFSKVIAFVKNILIARYLGSEGYGTLSFAIAFTSIFYVVLDLGINILTVREVARHKELVKKYIENIVSIKFILSFITLTLILITGLKISRNFSTFILVLIMSMNLIIQSYTSFFNCIFRAFEKMEIEAFIHSIYSVLELALTAIFIVLHQQIIMIASSYIASSFLSLILLLYIFRKFFIGFTIHMDIDFCKNLLREAWPFAISSVFVSIYFWIDTILLYILKSDEIVGWYNAAYRLVFSLSFIPSLIMYSIYPYLSRVYFDYRDSFVKGYRMSLKAMALISIPLFLTLFIVSKPLILFIYSSNYNNSVNAFRILLWAEFFAYFSHVFLFVLSAANKQKIYTIVVGISLFLNIVLDIILIPSYSYIGAGIATLATEFIAFLVLFMYTELKFARGGQNEIYW